MIHQLSTSIIKRLAPPGEAKTEPQKYLAQSASVRKFTRFDLAIAIVILLDFVLAYTDSTTKWLYVVSTAARFVRQTETTVFSPP